MQIFDPALPIALPALAPVVPIRMERGREQERRKLRESEARSRRLLSLTTDWYWEQDAEFRFTHFSGGRRPDTEDRRDLIGKRRWELPGVNAACNWDDHRAALQARESFRDFVYRVGEGGSERYISVSGEPCHDDQGRFLGYRGTACDITERSQAQERLRQSNAMLRMAMRIGRIGAWSMELPRRTLSWAQGGRLIYALGGAAAGSFDDLLQRTSPASRADLQAAVDACIAQGRRFDVELLLLPAALPGIWVRLVGEADRGLAGDIRRLQGTVEDITERRLAAERTSELGSRLVATLDTATDCFVTVNRDWCFTYVNQEAERLMRRSRDELLGRNMWHEFPAAAGTRFEAEYRRAVETLETVEFEEFFAPFGQWLQIKACPSPQGLAIYFRDITDSRSVRDALLDIQEQLHRLLENTIDGVLYTSADGRIVGANPSACAMLGRSREQLVQLTKSTLVPPQDGRLANLLERRAVNGRAGGELALVRGDGTTFQAEVSSTEYIGADGNAHAFVVFRDISERLRAQQEIVTLNGELSERVRQRTAELETANRELKAFAHSLAHDLRSPIAAIDGFTDMLERSLPAPLPERSRHYLARIRGAAGKMDAYTEGLLSLARISQVELDPREVDLSAIALDLLTQLQERDRDRVVVWHVQPGLVVRGDAALLRMALDNLLGNAWKFTSHRAAAEIDFIAYLDGDDQVVYRIQDNGAGFDMAYADKLFVSFQRLHGHAEFPGTGVGLANVQRIVARHGGRIWAESAPQLGAGFYFTLPPAQRRCPG